MTYLSLSRHQEGIALDGETGMVFEISNEVAWYGTGSTSGDCLVWRVADQPVEGAELTASIDLSSSPDWVLRCDRIDFPPGGIAYTHTHPGPGIRSLLFGQLTVTSVGETHSYGSGDPWFESGPEPVLAVASESEASAFVRVLVLPAEWAGKRTISYVNPEDEDRPKLQKATVYTEVALEMSSGA